MSYKFFAKTFLFLAYSALCGSEYTALPDASVLEHARKADVSYDEAAASKANIADILVCPKTGNKTTPFSWVSDSRPFILSKAESEIYGKIPPRPESLEFQLLEESQNAMGGIARRLQYKIVSKDKFGEFSFTLLIYIPKNAPKPVPVFQCLNFFGNHTVSTESEIIVPDCWARNVNFPNLKITDHRVHAEDRGKMASRWPIREMLERGYAVATAYYCEIFPDDYKSRGIDPYKIYGDKYAQGGAIAAWAWAHSRILDCLEMVPETDALRVAVLGHSRLAKTALVVGAFDSRFFIVISNDSGCMGAAISKRRFGENIKAITKNFPNWFSPNLNKYADNEKSLPIDQNHFLATIAPPPTSLRCKCI